MGDLGEQKLRALCEPLSVSAEHTERAAATLRRLMAPWGDQPVPSRPTWPSDITDDHSPFELSVAVEPGRTDLRALVEAQGPDMESDRGWRHALALTEALGAEPGVSLDRFETIRHLFEPDNRVTARFGLWHAAVVPQNGPVLYKLYLNPQVLGRAVAPGLVREALETLKVDRGWEAVQQLMAVDATGNELLYFALDLADTDQARVKVYVAHHGVQASSLNKQLSLFANYEPGHATSLIQQLADHDGPFVERPVLTCLGFSGSQAEPEVTIHFPVRCYADNDAVVARRLERIIGGERGGALRAAIGAYAQRDLTDGRGLVTYVSLRPSNLGTEPRTVAYLSPESFEVARPLHEASSFDPAGVKQSGIQVGSYDRDDYSLQDLVSYIDVKQLELLRHPYIQYLEEKRLPSDVPITAKGLAFFVMAFQDVLRLAAVQVTDPTLAPMIRNHFSEDAGHEQWFLNDVKKLGVDLTVPFLFSRDHKVSREVGYSLVSEVLRAENDAQRLAVVLSLEAVGHVFFERIICHLEAYGQSRSLEYFGRHHQEIEHNHAVYDDDARTSLDAVKLTLTQFREVCESADVTFSRMTELADDLMARVAAAVDTREMVG